jgi:CRP-like cAMP-binding protein
MIPLPHGRNRFLALLSAAEFALLRPHLAAFDLRPGERLHRSGAAVDHVIFPHSGAVALTLDERPGAGAILIGRDGIVGGLAAAAAAPANCDAEVYVGGQASRVPAVAFRYAVEQNAAVRRLAARVDHALMAQAQQTAMCNAVHPVEARLCRWLREVQERSGDDDVPLTQSALAQMLGVRRTTVTLAAGQLEVAGVIKCLRGHVRVVDPAELDRRSCACFGHVRDHAARLFAEAVEPEATVAAVG